MSSSINARSPRSSLSNGRADPDSAYISLEHKVGDEFGRGRRYLQSRTGESSTGEVIQRAKVLERPFSNDRSYRGIITALTGSCAWVVPKAAQSTFNNSPF